MAPAIQKLLMESSNMPATGTAQQFTDDIAEELGANRALIQSVGLKLE